MKIVLKYGIDKLLFGMKTADVNSIYGKPDAEFKDDEKNLIYVYHSYKWRLTFYQDEDFRLGYIICAHPELELAGHTIIGGKIETLKEKLKTENLKDWELEHFDITENHFNESNWLILQSEFGEVLRVEMGAMINDNDEFDWKFNK